MFTASQIICHLVGDYIIQTDWMAQKKTVSSKAALIHAVTYTLPFLFLTQNTIPLLVICLTHFLIDRFRLAKYVCWAKNQLAPKEFRYPLSEAKFGYKAEPAWLNVWLLIIADNTMHLIINGLALHYFG